MCRTTNPASRLGSAARSRTEWSISSYSCNCQLSGQAPRRPEWRARKAHPGARHLKGDIALFGVDPSSPWAVGHDFGPNYEGLLQFLATLDDIGLTSVEWLLVNVYLYVVIRLISASAS